MSIAAVFASCVALALVDAINPTAIVLTGVLMLTRRRWVSAVLALVAGEITLYFGVGVFVLLGASRFGEQLGAAWNSSAAYAIEAVVGLGLLIYSFRASPTPREGRSTEGKTTGALFALGVTIAGVEFSTALPYMGALSLLLREQVPTGWGVLILLAYNLVMQSPILLLGLAYGLMPGSVAARVQAAIDKNRGKSRSVMLWIVGILGVLLMIDAVNYAIQGLLPPPGRQ